MIITDGVHVVSTVSLEELHIWAKRNNIAKKYYFHGVRKGHPHYDLPSTRKFLLPTMNVVGSRKVLLAAKGLYELKRISPSRKKGSQLEKTFGSHESSVREVEG